MLAKPEFCSGCILETAGRGYAPAVGPPHAPILFVGEALGWDEAERGEPFVGAAGGLLDRVIRMVGMDRSAVRIDNAVRCRPPDNKLDGAHYESSAVAHCSQYLDQTLAEGHKVVVPLGKSAIRRILGVPKKGTKVQDFHGTIQRDPTNRFWVVPSFHPSHLQRGAFNLLGTVSFDFKVALEVAAGEARGGWTYPDFPSLVVDPPVAWFKEWVLMCERAAMQDPAHFFLHVDTETEEKLLVGDEGELNIKADPAKGDRITRFNFACGPDEGVTVPASAEYLGLIAWLLQVPGAKWFHNARYDVPRIKLARFKLTGPVLDSMWAWHVLQSDTPRGLGYIAPFYSRLPAWKHLSQVDEGYYAAMDAVQGWRVADGISRDLHALGMWEVYTRHLYEYDEIVLFPAEEVGLPVDRKELVRFKEDLAGKQAKLLAALQEIVPESVKPLLPREGWAKRPKYVAPDATEVEVTVKSGKVSRKLLCPLISKTVRRAAYVCHLCGAVGVQRRHRCSKTVTPLVVFEVTDVVRWYAQTPFSPNSPPQILRYMAEKGHAAGKSKKDKPTTDKDTLTKLARSTSDPFYRNLLDHRAVYRVLRTYVDGTLERLDSNDRVHAQFLHVPSTLRLSCVPLTTEILTVEGWKKHDQLRVGEEVIGYDVAAGTLRRTPLEAVHYKKDKVGFVPFRATPHGAANGVACTAEHRWVVEGAAIRGLTEAHKLNGHGTPHLILAAPGLPSGDLDFTPTEAGIIGWAITDGYVKHLKSGKYICSIAVAKPKTVAALELLLAEVPYTVQEYIYGKHKRKNFYLGTDSFTPLWERVLKHRLDALVLGLSHEARVAMWEAMMEADGSRTRGDERFGCQTHEVDTFTALCAALGRRVAYKERRKTKFIDFHVHQSATLPIRNRGWIKPRAGAGDEEVWCPQTGCGTWVMRTPSTRIKGGRGMGQVAITGNCRSPNLQNVIADRGGEALADGFRNCIVAGPDCEFSSADAAGIEAVLVGYFCRDPDYIRLAQRGIHAYVASHLVGKPADKSWPDSKLVPYLREIKEHYHAEYAKCKRTVHLSNYGGTPKMMVLSYPDTFKTEREAAKLYNLYLDLCPNLKPWWHELRSRARRDDRIGGPGDHPYGYLHWFYNLTDYRKIAASSVIRTKSGALQDRNGNPVIEIAPGRFLRVGLGEDAKRVVAFKPQSTARGVQTEVAFRLFTPGMPNYLGDIFYGRTPLRALIHDDLLLEHLIRDRARVHAALVEEMTRPIEALPFDWLTAEERGRYGFGTHLQIGVEVKVGKSWGSMVSCIVSQPGVELAADGVVPVDETDDEDEGPMEEEMYDVA